MKTNIDRLKAAGFWPLAERIARECNVDPDDAYEVKRHHRHAAKARRILVATIRWTLPDMSFQEIGALIGLDHTTVMHACDKREIELLRMHREACA